MTARGPDTQTLTLFMRGNHGRAIGPNLYHKSLNYSTYSAALLVDIPGIASALKTAHRSGLSRVLKSGSSNGNGVGMVAVPGVGSIHTDDQPPSPTLKPQGQGCPPHPHRSVTARL